jgi:hypothetical protein
MHQQLWGYKVEWKSVSRGTGGKRLNTTGVGNARNRKQVRSGKKCFSVSLIIHEIICVCLF